MQSGTPDPRTTGAATLPAGPGEAALAAELSAEFKAAVGRTRWRTWFRDVGVRRFSGDELVLAVPTEVHRTWIGFTLRDVLQTACAHVVGDGVHVRLEVDERQDAVRRLRDRLPATPREWEHALAARRPPPTFEGFVTPPEARFAVQLLQSLVHGGSASPAPVIYLVGESGCGKSHLLGALHAALERAAPGEALLTCASRFTSSYGRALRSEEAASLRAFEADVLGRRLVLLDGLEGLSGRSATQAVLVRLLERAALAGPRFVVAGRALPRDLEGLLPGLASRLVAGPVVRLPAPGRALLGGVLAGRAQVLGVPAPPEVLEAVLDRSLSPQTAVTWIERWALASERAGRPLLAAELGEVAPPASVSAPDEVLRRVKAAVARHFGVAPALLERPTKQRAAALPRRIAVYLAYRAAAVPLGTLARAFGFRSHSSVSRAIHGVREARQADAELEALVDGLLARL